ncbi:hypothetical protein H0H93_011409 [Arthromyces matolae]|nr:hypothetical protein H0H93_011409 [Arthromyces matolae]
MPETFFDPFAPLHSDLEDRLSISAILHALRTHGVRTLMVEGGARIIASIFEASISETSVIDSLIVTIAPTLVGKEGIGYEGVPLDSHTVSVVFTRKTPFTIAIKTRGLHYIKTDVVGKDTIIAFASQSTESD